MALAVTPFPRNLATKVTFLYLEFEDLFVILGPGGRDEHVRPILAKREMFGIPMNVFLQYVVPVLSIPALIPIQVRETARLPAGLADVSHEAARVLRTGVRLGTAHGIPERGILNATNAPPMEDSLRQPALCELLPVRDYLDGCIIRTNGCFVAGYEASD